MAEFSPQPSLQEEAIRLVGGMLEAAGFAPESVKMSKEGDLPHPLIAVQLAEAKRLIGPRGEHLRAFNTLVRALLEQRFGKEGRRVLVDINRYHLDYIASLRSRVRVVAERVRSFGVEVELAPMGSYERMIIHAMFANDPDVTTESRGSGRQRHVVLIPRNKPRFASWEAALRGHGGR
jgi:spoIIIJ-associated protein